jgi:putative salt-induced outer membrane protein
VNRTQGGIVPHPIRYAVLLLLAALPSLAAAQEPTRPTKLTADLGYVKTGGNSDVTTVTASDKLEHKAGIWLFAQEAGAVWGETDGVESAGRYGFGVRADRGLGPRLSAYGLAAWRRNTFAGISRQFDEGVGLSWKAVITKPHSLDIEAGAGLNQRTTTLAEEQNFGTARGAAVYGYDFAQKSRFEARGAYLLNLKDTEDSEGNARFSLTAPIAGVLALKVGYDLSYRNQPLPGLEKLDTTFSVGVQATL